MQKGLFRFILYLFILVSVSSQLIPGGPGPTRPATRFVQRLINEFRNEISMLAGYRSFPIFRAISFRTQVVSGTNYYIKIKVGSAFNSYIHAKLHVVPWLNTKEVKGVQVKKLLNDHIEVF